jgi:transposase
LPVEGIGLDAIQASKPEPRIMRYELTDVEWAAIRSFLPTRPRGIPRVDDRRVLNGIFWQFDRCFFNKIKQCRRVATRYDKLAANYLAFVKLASIRIWLRANESSP